MKLHYFLLLGLSIGAGHAQVSGCTDPLSTNYNAQAVINDGSCVYAPADAVPVSSVNLPGAVNETSGLIKYGNQLYTHNDNTDINLYALDSSTGSILRTMAVTALTGVTNTDWEEIAQDELYMYIGDFGNNSSGNRTDLKILKIPKSSLILGQPIAYTINFTYSNQENLDPAAPNATDFDCEAFVVSRDNIYLFTKQWVTQKTSVYALPKTPGTHVAELKGTYDVNGLITGATYLEDKQLLVLLGYSPLVQPFFYMLYDFNGDEFFSGNKRKVNIPLAFHQMEGIATDDGLEYFVTNEHFEQQPFVNTVQKLHKFNLAPYLNYHINGEILKAPGVDKSKNDVALYPNPVKDILNIDGPAVAGKTYTIADTQGKIVLSGKLTANKNQVNTSTLAGGLYVFRIADSTYTFKVIKN